MIETNRNKDYRNIFIIFAISRLLLFLIATIITKDGYRDVFANFDIVHYLDIAQNGYTELTSVFFPVLPLCMSLFNMLGIPIAGMMCLNTLLALGSAILLYKLTDDVKASICFICSPIAIFTFITYTESLFVFFTLLVMFLYKKEKYLAAGISLGIGVCCRHMTAMLFFSIFVIMFIKWMKKEISIKPILQMYIPATLLSLSYPIYLQIVFGDWNVFMDSQFVYWAKINSNIFSSIMMDIQYLSEDVSIIQKTQVLYQFILLMLIATLIAFSIRKVLKTKNELDIICVIYLIFSIFAIYSSIRGIEMSPPSSSYYRYFYACVPVYILPSMFKNKYSNLYRNVFSIGINSILSMAFAVFFYINWFMC